MFIYFFSPSIQMCKEFLACNHSSFNMAEKAYWNNGQSV